MRLFSVLTALLVAVGLYALVFERERLLQFAGATDPGSEEETGFVPASEDSGDPQDDTPRVSVVAMESVAQVIDRAVILRGRTEAARQVEVRAETSGLITSEPLRKGNFVEAGQVLCEIDPGTRAATLAEAEARLAEARANLPAAEARVAEAEAMLEEAVINDNAASRLSQSGFAAETRVAQTRASVSSARAAIESAQSGKQSAAAAIEAAEASVALAMKEIERLTIAAPFAGILETDTAELGALMQPGGLCATVIQLDPIKLVGFVPEADVEKVALGAPAGAKLVSGREVGGTVTFLSRSADPQTRTFRVEVTIPNADLAIRDGQTAEIGIAASGAPAHLIPASAMTLDDSGLLGVRVVEQDAEFGAVAGFRAVTILRDAPEGVFLTGLEPTAQVIVVGQEFVTNGVPLTVSLRPETQSGVSQ